MSETLRCPKCQCWSSTGRECAPQLTCLACGMVQCSGRSKCRVCLHDALPSAHKYEKLCSFAKCSAPAILFDAPGRNRRVCKVHAQHVKHRAAYGQPEETVWARIVRLARLEQ